MQRTLVRVRVEFESCDLPDRGAVVGKPSKVADGCFEVDFDASLALDIDTTEQAVMEACAPARRDALGNWLGRVALDRTLATAGPGGRIARPRAPYPIDGEVGRFEIPTYEVVAGDTALQTRDLFPALRGKEQYLTKGFLELGLLEGTVEHSYRKTSAHINRIRRQLDAGTPATTLRDVSEKAGTKIVDSWTSTSEQILAENGFSAEGTSVTDEDRAAELKDSVAADTEYTAADQLQAAKEVGIPREFRQAVKENPIPYDRAECVVDISVDAVLAKRQKPERGAPEHGDNAGARAVQQSNGKADAPRTTGAAEAGTRRKSVSTKVAKINCDEASYCLVAPSYVLLFSIVLAFVLHNRLHGRVLCFFVDGERCLNNALLAAFSWHPQVRVILDWYHLTKKCATLLSLILNDREVRNRHLSQLKHILWYGDVDAAVAYLLAVDVAHVKNGDAFDELIAYLLKHRERIPCYAIRKQLGLRNSSNAVEKANDDLVSTRQKNHGMSWSQTGSLALAALTAVNSNGHRRAWLDEGLIPLSFAQAA